jgi:hypothetical protein
LLLFIFPGLDALVIVCWSQVALGLPSVSGFFGAVYMAPALGGALSMSYTGLCGAIEQTGATRLVAVVQ